MYAPLLFDSFVNFFLQPYPGMFYTGDGAERDEHGYICIKGRVDGSLFTSFSFFELIIPFLVRVDVINVSGHRLSTAEIESALIMHKGVAETAGTFILKDRSIDALLFLFLLLLLS